MNPKECCFQCRNSVYERVRGTQRSGILKMRTDFLDEFEILLVMVWFIAEDCHGAVELFDEEESYHLV